MITNDHPIDRPHINRVVIFYPPIFIFLLSS
jgi:hypothetical protein